MADAILKSGGSGGVGSDEVTASKAQVLQGYSTVTSDSDDEVVEGTIKSINTAENDYNINKSSAFGIDGFGRMWIDLPHGNGYYHRNDNKPHTCIDSAKLGDATTDKVLDGNTFTSKNGIAIRGTMANRGNVANTIEFVNAYWDSKFLARTEPGYYSQNGQWKPCVAIPYAVLASTAGIDANKMLSNLTVAGVTGNIKMINTQDNNYRLNKSSAFGIDNWSDRNNPVFWIDLPHGNGYYHRNDGHPHTCINADNLGTAGADSVLQGQTATSQHGVKFNGTIRRWVCNTGDVLSCANHDCFAWDDNTGANRGRGIVGKMLNSHFIQGANWLFIPSPNLYPHNIRAGVNINGITGTMPDYSTGREVFNGATFDGTLLLGVANKDFYIGRDYYALDLAGSYKYSGIYNGGINLSLSTSMPSIRGRYIGCIMSQSVNLTPFNRIDVYWRVVGDVKNDAYIDFDAGIAKASALRRGGITVGSDSKDGFNEESVKGMAQSPAITKSGKIELYVGGINEQAFLYFCASVNISSSRDAFTGSIQITRIDFLN